MPLYILSQDSSEFLRVTLRPNNLGKSLMDLHDKPNSYSSKKQKSNKQNKKKQKQNDYIHKSVIKWVKDKSINQATK
jgi:hypothetical protein